MCVSGPDSYYVFGCDCGETNWVCVSGSWKAQDVYTWKCWVCGKNHLLGDEMDPLEAECSFPEEWEECGGDMEKFKQVMLTWDGEDGGPHPDYSSAVYERFLDSECEYMHKGAKTWRAYLLEALSSASGGTIPWGQDRPGRREMIKKLVDKVDKTEGWCKLLAGAFAKTSYPLDCQDKFRDKNDKLVDGGTDWEDFSRELKRLLEYMLGV